MQKKLQKKSAIFFTILFMAIICAPSVIMSFDDTIDVTILCGENEEEEKENFKLLFEFTNLNSDDSIGDNNDNSNIGYTFKTYPKPHLNLISPPPEFIS